MLIIDGKAYAFEVEENLRKRVAQINARCGKTPVLATILVGDNPASVTYVRMKGNACTRVGMTSLKVEMRDDTTTEELLEKIHELNQNADVCGILLQHPVPKQIDEQACFNAISLEKKGKRLW